MQQFNNQNDSTTATQNTRTELFWLADSSQNFVDASCCELKNVYAIDSILKPSEFIFSNDSSLVLLNNGVEIRPSVITHKPFGKPLIDEPFEAKDNLYLSLFIVFAIFISGIISYTNRKSFSLLLKSTISSAPIYEIMRDRSHITGVFFTAPFMLSMFLNGIFISYTMRETLDFSMPVASDVLVYGLVIVIIQLLKNFLLKAIGSVFQMSEKTEEHILFSHQYFCFSSWIYIPALAIALAIPVNNVIFFHIFLIFNISISATYTTLKLFVNYSHNGLTSIALFILYICSTEVLPVLLILKTIYLIKD